MQTEPAADGVLKTRPWFQVHLSTAVVLMLVASGLVLLNLRVSTEGWQLFARSSHVAGRVVTTNWQRQFTLGWPANYLVAEEYDVTRGDDRPEEGKLPSAVNLLRRPNSILHSWSWWKLLVNLASVAAILVAVAIPVENIIRRRE